MRGSWVIATLLFVGGLLSAAPAATAAIPVVDLDCGDPVSSSVKLADDLIGCTGDGLVVDAANIVIDLNGHRITHDGSSNLDDMGIENGAGFFKVTVRNGLIRGFENGISVGQGGTHNIVENMVVVANTLRGVSFEHGFNRVAGNTIAGNFSLAIQIADDGNTIQRNLVYGNGQGGIELNGANGNTVSNNTFARNGATYPGIYVNGDDNQIVKNTVVGQGSDGIDLNGANRNIVKSNTLLGNGNYGIEISGDDNVFTKNTVSGSEHGGLVIQTGDRNRFVKNTANANGFDGSGPDDDGLGLDVAADLNVAGNGNVARGNADIAECDVATLCTGGPGGGGTTALDCGSPVTTSVVLGEDLVDCPASGLVVAAPNITIDLNGHRITHDGAPDPGEQGIDNSAGHDGVRITNGEVQGFDDGVGSGPSSANRITNVIVGGSLSNGIDMDGSDHVLKKNIVVASENVGVLITSPTDGQVVGNGSYRNAFEGLTLGTGSGNLVEANRMAGNGGSGITMVAADQDRFLANRVSGNGNFGLFVLSGDDVQIKNNTASGNVNTGAFVASGMNAVITGNRTIANGYSSGVSNGTGLGIDASGAIAPSGTNVAFANDDDDECDPGALC